jgi:hypothetical protein
MSAEEVKLRDALRGLSQLSGIAPARLDTMTLDELRAVHQQTLEHLRETEAELSSLAQDPSEAGSLDATVSEL